MVNTSETAGTTDGKVDQAQVTDAKGLESAHFVRPEPKEDPLAEQLSSSAEITRDKIETFQQTFKKIKEEVGKVIVGMDEELSLIVASVLNGGHVLMEGTPGLGKTLLVNSVAKTLGLDFKRLQFTPDMMPADITGSMVLDRNSGDFHFRRGPIFANIILADEINRSGPKTQAALLEAMQEKQITCDGTTIELPYPFLVLATQNPLESQGTYPLPDAQLDRFALKVQVSAPSIEEKKEIMRRTTSGHSQEIEPLFGSIDEASEFIQAQRELVKGVVVSEEMLDMLVQVVTALDPRHPEAVKVEEVEKYVNSAPSPRGEQSVLMLAKVFALAEGRAHIERSDLQRAMTPALRHRITIRPEEFEEGISTEKIIEATMKSIWPDEAES